jgi:magnesium transporter
VSGNWYDIRDPDDPQLDALAGRYGLHPLHIEDCRHRNQNAKIEAQNNYLFVVLKPVDVDEDHLLTAADLDIFIGPDWFITVQESRCESLSELLNRVKTRRDAARPDQLFYWIADGLVDAYNPVLDRLTDRIDEMEDEALKCPEPELLEEIFDMRRSLIQLRRIMANTRDVMGHVLRTSETVVGSDLAPFFRDIYDHVMRNMDAIEIQRDLLTGTMELYLSAVANRTNQVMKVLTVFGTIATPALVITGMYGMNLTNLPFANHPHSWGIVMTIIACVSAAMLLVLRKLRWL